MTTWQPDVLPGYEALTLVLPEAQSAPGEPETDLVATLVRRVRPAANSSTSSTSSLTGGRRAVLYVHGWNDYFFQTELADQFESWGIDFYALDLRRYGRSLRPGLFPGFIEDVEDYHQELDLAFEIVSAAASSVAVMGHSTGGLVVSLWANARSVAAVMLNSPWLDLAGFAGARFAALPLAEAWSKVSPTAEIPMPSDGGYYSHMTHISLGGEWDYQLAWKSPVGVPVRAGWIRAILNGQAKVASGLNIAAPVLVCSSMRSDFNRVWSPLLRRSDIVLDVEMIAARAVRLGPSVTLERIEGGMHDLALSDRDAREAYYAALRRWITAYWPA